MGKRKILIKKISHALLRNKEDEGSELYNRSPSEEFLNTYLDLWHRRYPRS